MKSALLSFFILAFGLINAQPRDCGKGNGHLRRNRGYLFHYEGTVESGIQGTTEKTSKLRINAEILVEHLRHCEYILTISNAKLEESFGVKDAFIPSSNSREAATELSRFPLRFTMEQGLISDVRPALKERQKNILNIKRGILSTLQIKWAKKRSGVETDVSGICEIKYEAERGNDTMKIVKKKDIESCRERSMAHASLETMPFEKVSSIYDAESQCEYQLKKKNEIEHVICNERYLLKPFSTQRGAGSYLQSTQKLVLRKSRRVRPKSSQSYPEYYTTSLLFEHKHEEAETSQASTSKAMNLLERLVKEAILSSNPNTANIFSELVFTLRLIDERGFGLVMGRLGTCLDLSGCTPEKLEAYWSFFFEALAQCGSTSCVNILSSLIMNNKVPKHKVDKLISSIAFIQEPSTEMINTVMGLHKRTSNPTSLLLLGTLMHKFCKHKPSDCSGNAPIQSAIRNADYYLLRILGNDCSVRDSKRAHEMYHALRAIGNAGRPRNVRDLIVDCIKNAAHVNVSVAAVHALRRMPKDDHVKEVLREIVSDKNVDTERRMEAFLMLMEDPIDEEIILAVDMVHDEQEAGQLRSFFHSFLTNAVKNKNPMRKRVTEKFKRVLASKNMTKFDPPAARFSKVFEYSSYIDFLKVGAGIKSMMFFHPESYVPRTVRVGLSAQALGHHIDFVELDARLEGLEIILEKLFSEGYIGKDFMKRMFSIPRHKYTSEENVRTRGRRNVQNNYLEELDNQVNIKESTPQALLSVKVYGNEIDLLTLDDIPLLNGKMESMNVIEQLHALSKGRKTTFRRSVLFMEGSYVVPTIVGLPLSIQLNGSAVVILNVQGKVNIKNMFIGPKTLKIEGAIKPSANVEISGKMMVDAHFTKIGVHVNATTFSSTSLGGEIEYEEGKKFRVNIDVPEKPIDIFNYTHTMFQVIGSEEKRISGSPRRTETSLCADDVYSSSKMFGVDVCTDMSFPVSYHNIEAPYYPLTGPVKIGFRLLRRDPLLKTYRLVINKRNDVYHVNFGTPDTQIKREYTMDLGLTTGGNRGVIGATFGQSRKGALLRYEYDNSTHGIKVKIISNLTKDEMTISGHYFNTTDPVTLDRRLGVTFRVKTKGKIVHQKIFFEDTYEYWAVWWKMNSGPKTETAAGFKVQYHPQIVETVFKHEPSKSDVTFKIKPNFPVTAIEVVSAIKGSSRVNASIAVDLKDANIQYHSIVFPSNERISGKAKWIRNRRQQGVKMELSRNKKFYEMSVAMNYQNEDKVFIGKLRMERKTHYIKLTLSKNGIQAESSVSGIPGRMNGIIINDPAKKSLEVAGSILNITGKLGLNYQFSKAKNAHSLCVNATLNRHPVGICSTAFYHEGSKGLNITVGTFKGELQTYISHDQKKIVSTDSKIRDDQLNFGINRNGKSLFRIQAFRDNISDSTTLSGLFIYIPPADLTFEIVTSNSDHRYRIGRVKDVDYNFKVIRNRGKFILFQASQGYMRNPSQYEETFSITFRKPLDGPLYQQWTYEQTRTTEIEKPGRTIEIEGGTGDALYRSFRSEPMKIKEVSQETKFSYFGKRSGWQHKGLSKYADGKVTYDGKFVNVKSLLFIKSLEMLNDLVPVSPVSHQLTYTMLIEKDSKVPVYLTKLGIYVMKRTFDMTYDPTTRKGHFTLDLLDKGYTTIGIEPIGEKSYKASVSYRNATWNMGTVVMHVSKDGKSNMWRVSLAGPELTKQQLWLKSLWQKARQDFMKALLSKMDEILQKMKVSSEVQEKVRSKVNEILNTPMKNIDLSKLAMDFEKSVMSSLKTMAKENINKGLDLTLEAIFKSSLKSDYQLNSAIKAKLQTLKNLVRRLGTSILSLDDTSISSLSKELKSASKDLVVSIIKSPETRQIFKQSFTKSMSQLNLTQADSESIIKRFSGIDYSKIFEDENELRSLWKALKRVDIIMKKHQYSTARKELVNLLTVNGPKVLQALGKVLPETELKEVSQMYTKVAEILRNWRYDITKQPAENLLDLFNRLKTVQVSKALISKIVPVLIGEALEKAKVSNILATSIVNFVNSQNYVRLFKSMLRISFEKLNITGDYDQYIKEIMESDDMSALDKIAKLVVENSRAEPELRQYFEQYLQDRNTKKLINSVVQFYLKPVKPSIRNMVSNFIETKNLTILSRDITVQVLRNAKLPPKVKQLVHEIIKVKSYRQLAMILLHYASQLPNSTTHLDNLVSLAQNATGVYGFISTYYQTLLQDVPISSPLRNVLKDFGESRNFAELVKRAYKLGEKLAFSKLNVTGFDNLAEYIKLLITKNMKQMVDNIPERWRDRVEPVFEAVKKEIERFEPRKVSENATKAVLELMDGIYDSFNKYASTKLATDLERDAKGMVKEFGQKLSIGNSTAAEIYNRITRLVIDRSLLSLRMLAQLLPSHVRAFQKQYIDGKTIRYKRIYKDFLQTEFTSQAYMEKVNEGYNRVTRRILTEIRSFTGDFSSRATVLNLLQLVSGLNMTDGNSFLRSYNKVKNMKRTKGSSLVMMYPWKKMAKTIGRWRIGDKTVDELVKPLFGKARDVLDKVENQNREMKGLLNLFFQNATTGIRQWNYRLKKVLDDVSNQVTLGFSKRRKLYTFISDLTLPLLGGAYFAGRRLPLKSNALYKMHADKIKKFTQNIKEYDEWSFADETWSFIHNSKNMEAEKSLMRMIQKISAVADGIHESLLKKLMFVKDRANEMQSEVDSVLGAIDTFLRKKGGKPLYRIVEKAAGKITSYYKSAVANSTIERKIIREFAPMIKSVSVMNMLKTAISNTTRMIKETMKKLDLSKVESLVRATIPAAINNATLLVKNAVVKSLRLVDNFRKSIKNDPFLTNPKQYLQQLPGTMMKNLTKQFHRIRPVVASRLNEIETKVRGIVASLKTKTQIYLKKMQSVIDNVTTYLRNADKHIGKEMFMDKSKFMKILRNYSNIISEKTDEYNTLISKQFDNMIGHKTSKKLSLKAILTNVTVETRKWLKDIEKTIKSGYANFTNNVIESLQKQTEIEKKSKNLDVKMIRNLTRYLEEAKKLSAKYLKTVESSLIKVIGVIKQKLPTVEASIAETLSNWTNMLQEKYSLVKQHIMVDGIGKVTILIPHLPSMTKKNISVPKIANLIKMAQVPKIADMDKLGTEEPVSNSDSSSRSSSSFSSGHKDFHRRKVTPHPEAIDAILSAMKKMDKLSITPYANQAYNASLFGITSFPRALEKGIMAYHTFLNKLDADLGKQASKIYKEQLILPLKRITANAAVDAPVDRLPPMPQINGVMNQAGQLFKPLPRTATLFGNHVFTFDGSYVIIPNASGKESCTYLLARDFRNASFTLLYSNNRLIIQSGHSKVTLSKAGKVEISSRGMKEPIKELPAQAGSMLISRYGPTVKIQSVFDFQLFCNMDIFLCNFTVSGVYHNKTLGLFGTNNVEYADDLRLPDGRIATDLPEFVSAWEVSRERKCQVLDPIDFTPQCRQLPSPRCRVFFKHTNSSLAKAFSVVNPYPYITACEYETSKCEAHTTSRTAHCPVVKAYLNIAAMYGVKLDFPNECALCKDHRGMHRQVKERTAHKDHRTVDITVIMRDAATTKRALKNFREVMRQVDRRLDYSQIDRRYSLVGFGGNFYRRAPYTQTGNGKVFGNINDFIAATNNLEFKSNQPSLKNLGLDALKFASGLRHRPTSTKVFIMVDNNADYSGALKEMMEANALLLEKGIILNVINKYRFKKNVIGKDSSNKRYHSRIAKGEKLRSIVFPPADDYLPIVKETRGAVMTIKGLMSSNEKWMKAFPISLNSIIQSQIREDKSMCKTCVCMKSREGFGFMSCRKDAKAKC